jgi:hypothetical protein
MKSEQRHKLQTNQLADTLGHELEYVKPYLKTILGILIAVVAVGFAWAYLSSQQTAKNDAAWTNFFDVVASPGEEDLDKYVEAYGDTPAGLWAKLAAADMKLNRGSFEMYRDRKEAEVQLDQAKKQFLEVIEAAKNDRMILRRAQLGLASTYEALNSPEEAEPIYEKLAKDSGEDAIGMAAKERLRQMTALADQKWFAWYDKYTPPPSDPNAMGRDPFDLNNLPGQDNLRGRDLTPRPGSLLEDELNTLENEKPLFPGFTPDSTEPDSTEPDPAKPEAPAATEEESPTDPAPAEPAPTDPAPTDPAPTESEPAPPAPEDNPDGADKQDDAPAVAPPAPEDTEKPSEPTPE